ncbi:2,4-dichlorophenol 6-monooxygenase [Aurantimicrobium minutum]|uniref:FAD-dependent oxidoreductase n=1 Tax=Aurantimicrobium minutum TaxID=708131 RepID=UPI002476BE49|nr:FAD-dependent monooxygenase [Aurantimicrobium minutum]MDH6532570.1 2,4-dichlorophenol 6-monooxygenase [Aurantimicrobium minutum]
MPIFNDGIAETVLPGQGLVETDVVIIGSGPAGASMALALSRLGIKNIMLTKYRWTANTPRAHITNQRAMEFFRELGIEEQVKADSTPHHLIGDTVFCTSIAGEELGRILTWGTSPERHADYEAASPTLNCDIPQTYLEPILVKNATMAGTQTRFSSEYLSHVQDAEGVTVRVLDRVSGLEFSVRGKYLYAADGARSKVAEEIGLDFEGAMDIAGSMNITFKADIAPLVNHRPSVLYWVVQPGANVGGIGTGLVRMVRPWNEWLIVWGYDINGPTPDITEEMATEIVRNLLGMPDLDIEITGYSLWGVNEMYATTLQRGRVFCGGDAIHRHPPSNGLGSNTSVQDSYNLAWKIASVIKGYAGSELLETYTPERAPVAKQIVLRANKSSREFADIFTALGFDKAENEQQMAEEIRSRKDNTPEARQKRNALAKALKLKDYEFNSHGVEMGQFYESSAVLSSGMKKSAPTRDPELYYHPSTFPGSPLPHVWVGDNNRKYSTLDLCPSSQFTLITGISGQAWAEAAEKVAAHLDIPLKAVVIGPGREVTDLYFDWERAREIDEDGVLLVRPDKIIAWRSICSVKDPVSTLTEVLNSVLSRQA